MNYIILLALILITIPAQAKEILVGPIPAELVSVRDGDTIDVKARIWLGQTINVAVRINGIDTPELKGKCEAEIRLAHEAKVALGSLLNGGTIQLTDIQHGKYAERVLATVTVDKLNVADRLMELKLARPYTGGKRGSWCDK
ncbi:thermonuclease family protein [Magnetovibrio blakemorei]|uniref:TNase-like domain-containing protein n=1 Tax=Magnetovibrio blakemorei TaxID=28181 RepID=A0A1E5Q4G8_9PROT|nr:thermonuclease family protein [Magnetovibrio blakemorei]OEJ64945.1 hypothetical protein BEN30_15870 [Magnetovibrio blakemorei]